MSGVYVTHLFDRSISVEPLVVVTDDLDQAAKAVAAYVVAADLPVTVPSYAISGQPEASKWLEWFLTSAETFGMMVVVYGSGQDCALGAPRWVEPYHCAGSLLSTLGDSVVRERLQSAHRAVGGLQRVGVTPEQPPSRPLRAVPNRG